MISAQDLSQLYKKACEVELQAFKPGNVSVYADGHDMTVDDFRVSAKVSAGPLCNPDYTLGEKIFYAVRATREAVSCNTNLGIILLCAPLIEAIYNKPSAWTLRQALNDVLINTTVQDAEWVFKAISLASPGGLGSSDEQDVKERPSVNLTEAMRLASLKDRIALQYITDYQDIFDFAVLVYYNGLNRFGIEKWAAVFVYASLLSQYPDSHIERKYGSQYTEFISSRMSLLSNQLSEIVNPEDSLLLLFSIDKAFKAKALNPGTMADITVATVLAVLLEDVIK